MTLLLLIITGVAAQSLAVTNLTLNGVLRSPVIGLDSFFQKNPRFSWSVLGGLQVGYQLTVQSKTGTQWDSGLVNSTISTQIPYSGAALSFDADYSWFVKVSFSSGSSATSQLAFFTTGLDSEVWASEAVWMGGCTAGQASPQLRFSFQLSSSSIERAVAYASGLGLYTLHINGKRVGGGVDVLSPGWSTVPTVRVIANGYDVLTFLQEGENVVGMRLGQGKYGYVHEFCANGDATCYAGLFNLGITQAGGNLTRVQSSEKWECAPSPIVFNHLFDGESYNASLDQAGWDEPGFTPSLPWVPVTIQHPNVSALSSGVPPIQTQANITPLSVTQLGGGGTPYIGNGEFIIAPSSPNVYWWANGTTVKNFLSQCTPCPGIDACGNLHSVTDSFMASLATGVNFTCAMLPTINTSSFVFDLGRNMAGVCSLALPPELPPGTTLTLVHGEILTQSGSVLNTYGTSGVHRGCAENIINCADQMDSYTYGSRPPITPAFTPSFTFHGFRYVGLFGLPSTAPPPSVGSLLCHRQYSAMDDAGGLSFNSSFSVLNDLQAAIVATQKSNLFSIASDCPTREKRGWMGDAQVSVDQCMLNLRATALYENWVRTFSEISALGCNNPTKSSHYSVIGEDGDTSNPPVRPAEYLCCGNRGEFGCQPGKTPLNATGSLPDVVPFDSISGWPGDWVWQTAGIGIPWTLLARENNLGFLELVYPYIATLMEVTASQLNGEGLVGWGPYGDWVAAEGVSTLFAENFYFLRAALQSADIAAALGKGIDAAAFTALAGQVGEAMVKKLWSPVTGVWDGGNGNQNAQAMALALGLGGSATANATGAIEAAMERDCILHGYHPTGGLSSIRWIFQGLHYANASMALSVATEASAPSFAYMVRPEMPGTIWEEWGGDAHSSDGSKNHPMFTGGLGVWLYEGALGLHFRYAPATQVSLSPTTSTTTMPSMAPPCPSLGFNPEIYSGLSPQLAAVACTVGGEAGVGNNLARIRARIGALLATEYSSHSTPHLQPRIPILTASPNAYLVKTIGSSSGWITSPLGPLFLSWSYKSPPLTTTGVSPLQFSLNVTLAWGVTGRVAIPLGLCDLGGRYRLGKVGGWQGELRIPSNSSDLQFVSLITAASTGGGSVSTEPPMLASEVVVEGLGRQWSGHGNAWERGAVLFLLSEGGEHGFFLTDYSS